MFRFTAALLMIASSLPATDAAPKPKTTPADELKELEGTWEVVTYERNGKKGEANSIKKVVIAAGKIDLDEREKPDLPIKVDPTKTPKAIDVYNIDAMMAKAHFRGIYELEGDELKICLPLSMVADRPTKFSSENFHRLYILRRAK